MPRAPFMQLFPADFLSGTLHLTTEQVGAHTLIFLSMWTAGGSLPNDPAKLARIARVSRQKWDRISGDILPFFQTEGDQLTQDRLKRDIEKVYEIIEKRSAAGKLGNVAKSLKAKMTPIANGSANSEQSERILKPELELEPKSERKEEGDISPPMSLPVVQEQATKGRRRIKQKITAAILEPEFHEFMRHFPNPIDEDEARRAYYSTRRSGRGTAADILGGAIRYAIQKRGTEPRFIKSPQNWLRAGSWKNPIQTPSTSVGVGNGQSADIHASVSLMQEWANQ